MSTYCFISFSRSKNNDEANNQLNHLTIDRNEWAARIPTPPSVSTDTFAN